MRSQKYIEAALDSDEVLDGLRRDISGSGPASGRKAACTRSAVPESFSGCWMCHDKRYVGNATGREPCVVCNREELRRLYPLHDPGDEDDGKDKQGYADDWYADRDLVDESDDESRPGMVLVWCAGFFVAATLTVLLVLFAGGVIG